MLIEHQGARPRVHPSAYVAPNAVLCGDVEVGPDCRILFGAVLTAEDGPIRLGERCIVMENAVCAGAPAIPCGSATASSSARTRTSTAPRSATRRSSPPGPRCSRARASGRAPRFASTACCTSTAALPDGAELPIGWIAVGDPAQMFPPRSHDEIWAIQRTLDFAGTVAGSMPSALAGGARWTR